MDRAVQSSADMISFGAFELVHRMGAGELGEVFLARTPWRRSRFAALKRMRVELSANAVFVERFRRTMRMIKAIDHANIVPLYDSGAFDGRLFTCSQLVPGRRVLSIADRLAKKGLGGPVAIALRVLIDTLSALVRIRGLVEHGAVARNVIVGWDGRARLSDLGIPRTEMEPDLRGLALATFRLLAGRYPAAKLSEVRPDLPAWFHDLLLDLVEGTGSLEPERLLRETTKHARRTGLLIPHSSVADWLEQLYPIERATELEMLATPPSPSRSPSTPKSATTARPFHDREILRAQS